MSIGACQMVCRLFSIVVVTNLNKCIALHADPRRTKRVVKYAQGTDMLDYVSGHRRLAGWLRSLLSQHPCARVIETTE